MKLNTNIWKNQQEFDYYYNIFLSIKKKKLKNFPEQISLNKWHSISSFFRSRPKVEKKEKSGSYNGNVRPLLNGQYGDKIVGDFTDWFRQRTGEKPDVDKLSQDDIKKIDDNWNMNKEEYRAMLNTFTPKRTYYYWQVQGDDIFDGKCSSLVNPPKYIPAHFSSFEKFRRKVN